MPPVAEHLAHRGPRDQAALRATVPFACLHVIGIEEERVARIGRSIRGIERREHEGLEEPARVCEMPLRGAHVAHRAHDVVLRFERPAARLRVGAHVAVPLGKRGNGVRSVGGENVGCGHRRHSGHGHAGRCQRSRAEVAGCSPARIVSCNVQVPPEFHTSRAPDVDRPSGPRGAAQLRRCRRA